MKKRTIIFIVLVCIMAILSFIKNNLNNLEYNTYRCKTKEVELNGVISWTNKKTNYSQIRLKGKDKVYSFDIDKIKFVKGFPNWVSYEIGDSIIKTKNSREVLVKRGNNYAIYILDCDN